jgi:hypothetical protein
MSAHTDESKIFTLPAELASLLAAPDTLRLFISLDPDDQINTQEVASDNLYLDNQGNLVFLEYYETSPASRDLIHSLWYGRQVAILVRGGVDQQFLIRGKPTRNHITGREFQASYLAAQKRHPELDLVAVWVIRPEQVEDVSPASRAKKEADQGFAFVHLDRLVSPSPAGGREQP